MKRKKNTVNQNENKFMNWVHNQNANFICKIYVEVYFT